MTIYKTEGRLSSSHTWRFVPGVKCQVTQYAYKTVHKTWELYSRPNEHFCFLFLSGLFDCCYLVWDYTHLCLYLSFLNVTSNSIIYIIYKYMYLLTCLFFTVIFAFVICFRFFFVVFFVLLCFVCSVFTFQAKTGVNNITTILSKEIF